MAAKESHSEKGLQTIFLMGTTVEQWGLVPVKWVQEMRKVPDQVWCPICHGNIYVQFDENNEVIPMPDSTKDYQAWSVYIDQARNIARNAGNHQRGTCLKCKNQRGACTGKVIALVDKLVWVGYPQWYAPIVFDSRFKYTNQTKGHSHCALCAKSIINVWSGVVPVQAKDNSGKAHGMWVGRDCARKILHIESELGKDAIYDLGKGTSNEVNAASQL